MKEYNIDDKEINNLEGSFDRIQNDQYHFSKLFGIAMIIIIFLILGSYIYHVAAISKKAEEADKNSHVQAVVYNSETKQFEKTPTTMQIYRDDNWGIMGNSQEEYEANLFYFTTLFHAGFAVIPAVLAIISFSIYHIKNKKGN